MTANSDSTKPVPTLNDVITLPTDAVKIPVVESYDRPVTSEVRAIWLSPV